MNKFSKSLYYPSIDINNEQWLKSAILFWDEISTIVPKSLSIPYRNYSTQYLYDVGILAPIYVNPSNEYVCDIVSAAADILNSLEKENLLYNLDSKTGKDSSVLPLIHEDKLHAFLCFELLRLGMVKPIKDGFYQLDQRLFDIYMALLATTISESNALALVTDNTLYFQLSERGRYISRNEWSFGRNRHVALKQGMLTNLVIDSLTISEDTLLSDIVAFRQHHHDELARFRINLAKLVDSIQNFVSFEALQQTIQTTYNDEFVPAYNDLKHAMKSSKIKWFIDNASKFCALSISTTALPVVLGIGIPQSLFISTGVSAVASVVSYNIEKQETLRKNPYAYLLNMIIPLVQPARSGNSEDKAIKQSRAKGSTAETETKFIEIGLQIDFWQAMIGTQNEGFSIANHDMQPMEQAGIGIVGLVLMRKAL